MAHNEYDGCLDLDSNIARVTAVDSRSRGVLQLLEIYAALIAVILVSYVIVLECLIAIYESPYVFPRIPYIFFEVPGTSAAYASYLAGRFGTSYQVWYVTVVVIVVICVGVLFYKSVHELGRAKNGGAESIRKTVLFEVAMLFLVTMYLDIVFFTIFEMIGVDVQTPDFYKCPDWTMMFLLLNAPVYEEIKFRVFWIGIPALIIALIMRKRDAPLRRYLAGGFGIGKISKSTVFLIFLSSFLFGVAHIENWGGWKFYGTFIGGLAMGYLFVKYGFYASVAMHFLADYLAADGWLFGDSVIIFPLGIIIMIVAVPSVCLYVKKGATFFKNFIEKAINF